MNVLVEFERPGMPKIRQIVIKKLGKHRAWGRAHQDEGIIEIDPRATGRKYLEVLIHESQHILQPYLTEDAVIAVSSELTRVIWETGFRKWDNDASIKLQDEEE